MPLTWPTVELPAVEAGTLYLVATPIGNRADITIRALAVMEQADLVAAEDTRTSGRLLAGYGIRRRLIAYHEHNEESQSRRLLRELENGRSVALISDAGTPLVSDPGYRLVKGAAARKITVVPIPGPSAVMAALAASGLPTDSFVFIGFAPRKSNQRQGLLEELVREKRTLIFFESPRRLPAMLNQVAAVLGNRHAVVARELTKLHEEFIRGRVDEILKELGNRPAIKGEVTLLVAGADNSNEAAGGQSIDREIETALDKTAGSVSRAAALAAAKLGISRRQAYGRAVAIKKGRHVESKTTDKLSGK